MKFLLLLIIPIYKYLINSYRLNRIEELYKYFQTLKSESPNKEIYETRSETLELFEIAKIICFWKLLELSKKEKMKLFL